MDDDDGAVAAIAAVVCDALADPIVCAEVADLLTGASDARRRRFKELADELTQELADVEIRAPLFDGDRRRG
jgi:hypothetical protein